MTQQRAQNAERIREVRLQLQSLVEDGGAVGYAQKTFLVGGMTARDFLADCLGLQHTASVDKIINNLKSILQ